MLYNNDHLFRTRSRATAVPGLHAQVPKPTNLPRRTLEKTKPARGRRPLEVVCKLAKKCICDNCESFSTVALSHAINLTSTSYYDDCGAWTQIKTAEAQ